MFLHCAVQKFNLKKINLLSSISAVLKEEEEKTGKSFKLGYAVNILETVSIM